MRGFCLCSVESCVVCPPRYLGRYVSETLQGTYGRDKMSPEITCKQTRSVETGRHALNIIMMTQLLWKTMISM